jgi:hypothetical protein
MDDPGGVTFPGLCRQLPHFGNEQLALLANVNTERRIVRDAPHHFPQSGDARATSCSRIGGHLLSRLRFLAGPAGLKTVTGLRSRRSVLSAVELQRRVTRPVGAIARQEGRPCSTFGSTYPYSEPLARTMSMTSRAYANYPVVVHRLPLRSQLVQVSLPQEVPEHGGRTTTELNNDPPSDGAGTVEASLGLAPIIVDRIFETLTEIAATGVSVLLVEQYVTRALAPADSACLSTAVRWVFTGSADELEGDEIFERYSGIESNATQ